MIWNYHWVAQIESRALKIIIKQKTHHALRSKSPIVSHRVPRTSESAESSERTGEKWIENVTMRYSRMSCLHSESNMCPLALHHEDSTTASFKPTLFNQNRLLSRSVQLLQQYMCMCVGGTGAKQKPKGISTSHVTLNGKNQNCVPVHRE